MLLWTSDVVVLNSRKAEVAVLTGSCEAQVTMTMTIDDNDISAQGQEGRKSSPEPSARRGSFVQELRGFLAMIAER